MTAQTQDDFVTEAFGPAWKHNRILVNWHMANLYPSEKRWVEYSQEAWEFVNCFRVASHPKYEPLSGGYLMSLTPAPIPHTKFTELNPCILGALFYIKHMHTQPRVLFKLDPDTYRFTQLTKRMRNKDAQETADQLLTRINARLGQLYNNCKSHCDHVAEQSKKRSKKVWLTI